MPPSTAHMPVAQYLRMSTEHQQYSTENQSISIVQYAQMHNMEIVRTYADHGKSGLSLARRPGLQQLLRDALASDVDFRAVLVYDVSRWGRFQNPDQGASYEYALITADIPIHYCAEQFANDGSLSSALLKTLKRGMAGEYSRELSVKVWAGQSRLVQLGFRLGGIPGYGLRRHLIDQNMVFKQVLKPGDRKSLQTDRVSLDRRAAEEQQQIERNEETLEDFKVQADREFEHEDRLKELPPSRFRMSLCKVLSRFTKDAYSGLASSSRLKPVLRYPEQS
jgi:DNA invertase Pin-like site-specific DNA recombinase